MKPMRQLIIGNKLVLHLFFCCGVLMLLLLGLYLLHISAFRFDVMPALVNCLFFLLCIYTGRWLCQAWYLRGKFAFFIIATLAAFLLLTVAEWLLVRYAFHHPNAGFIELFRWDMPFFLAGVVLGMLLKLISSAMQKELQEAQIKAEQKESELNLLQSQLSPHFLFNVLNNLYGISIDEHERIPGLLLKLSNLLRYSVYGAKKTFVPLNDELEYLNNYIDFEQIRISDRLKLVTDIQNVGSADIKIAPQVLIVFVENAFKHSKNTLTSEIDIHISLKIDDGFICMQVSNSYNPDKNSIDMFDENSGLGLANTIKRLDLLYGSDYKLKQYAENGVYHTEFSLKIKN